jgi:hypothetical protein
MPAPKIDQSSDALLIAHYDELYDNSPAFRSRLHNIVTSTRVLKLVLDPGVGHASFTLNDNSIKVWRYVSPGVVKTAEQIRDDIFFELHNARKAMALAALSGSDGYNVASLAGDIKKKAGYALANEWMEWYNVAESTLLAVVVNSQSAIGQLLPSPPAYQGQFVAGATSWLKFSNYLDTQVATNHTAHYDPAAAPGQKWLGKEILRVVNTKGGADLEIYANEFAPAQQQPQLHSRANPFTWQLLKTLSIS